MVAKNLKIHYKYALKMLIYNIRTPKKQSNKFSPIPVPKITKIKRTHSNISQTGQP